MKIFLRVMGNRLLERLATELAALNSAFPRQIGPGKPLRWQIEKIDSPFCANYFTNTPTRVSVVLVEVINTAAIEELWRVCGRNPAALCGNNLSDWAPAPVILAFDRDYPTSELIEMPMFVNDWVCGDEVMHDLVRRVFASLRRQRHLQEHFGGGMLILNSQTRRLCFNDTDSVLLSVAEVPLAELFLTHIGSVVPMEEIYLLFEVAGRSTSGSNIRVTIFQLRFKIEQLTRNYFSVVCAYGEGYSLRTSKSREDQSRWPQLEANQSMAVYTG